MQPQQPYQVPPPNPQPTAPNPGGSYDFIMNPSKPPRRSPFNGSSFGLRILVIVGGLFVLMLLLVGAKSVLGGGGDGLDKPSLLSVAQDQSELLHLTQAAGNATPSQQNKNFTLTTQLSITSEQTQFTAYLKKNGYKPKDKLLAQKQSAQIDTQLTNAQAASTFDSTYEQVMKDQLNTYKNDLSAAYNKAGPTGKTILQADYKAADLLLTQLTSQDNT